MSETVFLQMKDITKVYSNGVVANDKVNLVCNKGEIHALMGENGAGKSTLMKILFGVEQPTSGKIILNGEEVVINNPLDAIDKGIGMVHQHFMLDENLTVTENIILGIEPKKGLKIDYVQAKQMVLDVAEKYNFDINPDELIMDLDVGRKQKVEILKALIRGAEILILDEPTAVLTPQETKELFVQLESLRDAGHTIIFISHKLNEISQICSHATVMRNGKYVGSEYIADVSIEHLSRLMVGRDVVREVEKSESSPQQIVLSVKDLNVANHVNDISFNVRAGEILGIAGVEGNGQREIIDAITGLNNTYTGEITFADVAVDRTNPIKQLRDLGLYHIPEDRMTFGVMIDASIEENLISNVYSSKEYSKGFILDSKKINALSEELIEKFQIKTDSKHTHVRLLSGGNMQKVVAAREMSSDVKLLVADQPTRGIDIGTATFIHDQIVKMRDENRAILLSSADMNEVLELSDSLIVIYEGKIVAYFKDSSEVSEEDLGLYMLGLKQMSIEEISEVSK